MSHTNGLMWCTTCSWRVRFDPNLTSMIVPAIGAIYEVETNDLWIQIKSLSKRNCHLQLLSHFFGFEIAPATT